MRKTLLFIVFSLNLYTSYSQDANDYYDRGNAKQELKEYKGAKGSVQFPLSKPIPYELIRKIVRFRLEENKNNHQNKK